MLRHIHIVYELYLSNSVFSYMLIIFILLKSSDFYVIWGIELSFYVIMIHCDIEGTNIFSTTGCMCWQSCLSLRSCQNCNYHWQDLRNVSPCCCLVAVECVELCCGMFSIDGIVGMCNHTFRDCCNRFWFLKLSYYLEITILQSRWVRKRVVQLMRYQG